MTHLVGVDPSMTADWVEVDDAELARLEQAAAARHRETFDRCLAVYTNYRDRYGRAALGVKAPRV